MWMQVSSLTTNSSLQNTPRYQFSLKSETIDNLTILLVAILYFWIFVYWWPFWIQNGHHSKPTFDINSQHHNLLGKKISSKSEDFCILAAILNPKWPPLQTNDGYQFVTL
jgi:hypothetical protein